MRRSMYTAIIALALLALGSLTGVRPVSADLGEWSIEPMATRAIGGSYALAGGDVSCTAGESFRVVITMGQRELDAQARGATIGACTGEPEEWTVTALTVGDGALLQPGSARICWNVTTTYADGQASDVRQGCGTVGLVEPLLQAGR